MGNIFKKPQNLQRVYRAHTFSHHTLFLLQDQGLFNTTNALNDCDTFKEKIQQPLHNYGLALESPPDEQNKNPEQSPSVAQGE